MKIISTLYMAVLTMLLLRILDLGCEAYMDHYFPEAGGCGQPPHIMVFIDGVSPIGFSYLLLPLMVGFMSWYSPPISAPTFIPATIIIAGCFLIMGVLEFEKIMNGVRSVTVSRYVLNMGMIVIGGLLCFRTWKGAKRAGTNAEHKTVEHPESA